MECTTSQGPHCSTASSVDSGKSARMKKTTIDNCTMERPERRTALVAMELAKYNIDTAALLETRFSESGSLNDLVFSFFWSGKPEGERMKAGMGFAIKNDISSLS